MIPSNLKRFKNSHINGFLVLFYLIACNLAFFCLSEPALCLSREKTVKNLISEANREFGAEEKISILMKALDESGDSNALKSKVNYELGLVFQEKGDILSALKRYRMALKGSEDPIPIFESMAECFIELGQIEQAARLLEKSLQTGPERAKPYALKGLIYERQGMNTRAIDEYTRALRYDPYSILALEMRSKLLLKEGKPRESLEDLNSLTRLKRMDPEIFMTRAGINLKLNLYEKALEDYHIAENLFTGADKDRAIREKARVRLKMGGPQKALEILKGHSEKTPMDHEVRCLKARALAQLNRTAEAKRLISYTIDKNPGYANAYMIKASLLAGEGALDLALESLNRAIRLERDFSQAYKERAKLFMALKDNTSANVDLTRAANLDPSDGEVFALRASTNMDRLLYDSAVEDLTKALDRLPNDPEILFDRARAYLLKDTPEKALEDLEAILIIKPRATRALSLMGVAKFKLNRIDEAQEDLNAAVSADPKDPMVWNNRGFFRMKTGKLKDALKDMETALGLDPNYGAAQRNMALILQKTKTVETVQGKVIPDDLSDLGARAYKPSPRYHQ